MNQNLRHVQYFLAISFLLVLGGLVYWQIAAAPILVARDDNPRLVIAEQRIWRGLIVTADGTPLAESILGPDGLIQRRYLYSELAPVTGYYSLRYGTTGLENAFDPRLRGLVHAEGALPDWLAVLLHRPSVGQAITATIELPAQLAAQAALTEAKATGAVVVANAQTGEILVMVSEPTFDPNTLDANWDDLVDDPTAPLLNRATHGIFPLGQLARLVGLIALAEAGYELPPDPAQMPLPTLIAPLNGSQLAATARQLDFEQELPFILPTEGAPIPQNLPDKVEEMAATPLHLVLVGMALLSAGQAPEMLLVSDPPSTPLATVRLMTVETAALVKPYAGDLAALALPEVTGNEPLSWYLGLVQASEARPPLVIVVVATTPESNRLAARQIAQLTLAALK